MATAKKVWAGESQIIGTGDAYSTFSGTTEILSSDIDLETNGYEGAQVTVEVNFDATPTDDVDVGYYPGRDATDYDDTKQGTFRLAKETDPNQKTFIITDFKHAKIGAEQTGATDSHDIRAYLDMWRWDVT
ncbi:MAG: hypothetical protein GY710_02205 [Desulfobacteraceae bacterium]|nr:hypothetical protein [Desulfobacteraceae bacterium]